LLITTSMALGWIFLVREVRDEAAKLMEKGVLLSRNLAADAELGVFAGNRDTLGTVVDEVLIDEETAFAVILDERGDSLLAKARGGFTVPPIFSLWEGRRNAEQGDAPGEVRVYRDPENHEEFYLARYPILTQKRRNVGEEIGFLLEKASGVGAKEEIGSVWVGLSTRTMRGGIRRLEKALGLATLGVIGMGILLTVLLVRIIADPVHQLVEATRRIARGDLDVL